MATVKIVPLLFVLHSDKIKPKQLKSLQNHGSLNHINCSEAHGRCASIGISQGGFPDRSPCLRKHCP